MIRVYDDVGDFYEIDPVARCGRWCYSYTNDHPTDQWFSFKESVVEKIEHIKATNIIVRVVYPFSIYYKKCTTTADN